MRTSPSSSREAKWPLTERFRYYRDSFLTDLLFITRKLFLRPVCLFWFSQRAALPLWQWDTAYLLPSSPILSQPTLLFCFPFLFFFSLHIVFFSDMMFTLRVTTAALQKTQCLLWYIKTNCLLICCQMANVYAECSDLFLSLRLTKLCAD